MSRIILDCVALLASSASARPPFKQALIDLFGADRSPKLRDCRTCHLHTNEDDKDPPHNAFGTRLKSLREELPKVGKKSEITARFLDDTIKRGGMVMRTLARN
jgi:hypothetical protein